MLPKHVPDQALMTIPTSFGCSREPWAYHPASIAKAGIKQNTEASVAWFIIFELE